MSTRLSSGMLLVRHHDGSRRWTFHAAASKSSRPDGAHASTDNNGTGNGSNEGIDTGTNNGNSNNNNSSSSGGNNNHNSNTTGATNVASLGGSSGLGGKPAGTKRKRA